MKGDRVRKFSFPYKMALVEAHLVMGVSERKLAHGHALLVYATMRELEEHGLIKEHVPLDTVDTPTSLLHFFFFFLPFDMHHR